MPGQLDAILKQGEGKETLLTAEFARELIGKLIPLFNIQVVNQDGKKLPVKYSDLNVMIGVRSGSSEDETVTITGPATVYEEDGETIHASVDEGETYTLTIAYREVTDTINGNCEFKRMVKCSLPYILE